MQLSQRSDDSSKDNDDQDREYHLVDESLASPLVPSTRIPVGVHQEATAATSLGSVSLPPPALPDLLISRNIQSATKSTTTISNKLADLTPHPRVPRQPSVFVPATPSQNKISHKDAFGSSDTDLSELSDDSGTDSMKALSQKLAARTDSMIAITKRAPVLIDTVSSAGAPGKKVAERRVLDSEDEDALSNSRKDAKGVSKPGARNMKKAPPTVVISDVEDDIPPPPAPLKSKASRIFLKAIACLFFAKGRIKPTVKNLGPLDEKHKPPARNKVTPKRKREDKDEDVEVGGVSGVQEKPPPVKRARKTAGGKPVTTRPKAVSPAPPRDSQVLKKARPAAKNTNYCGRTKAARTSPARDSAVLSADDDSSGSLDLQSRPVDPCVEPPLMGDGDDEDYVSSPPALPKRKPKSKAAAKPKSTLAEKPAAPEKPKTAAMKARAKTQAGTRTRAAVTKAKDADDKKAVKTGPPQKAKAKAKRKPEDPMADEGGDEEGKEEGGVAESTKDSPAVIEVFSSPLEPPKVILPKRKPVSRVTSQEVVFNSLCCIHASLIVALIVHTREVLQAAHPRSGNQQRTVPHRRRSFSSKVRKILGLERWLRNRRRSSLSPLFPRRDLPPPKREQRWP